MPIMKIVNIHDINSNKDVPLDFARWDNSSIGNGQFAHKGESWVHSQSNKPKRASNRREK